MAESPFHEHCSRVTAHPCAFERYRPDDDLWTALDSLSRPVDAASGSHPAALSRERGGLW
jgi:hypothetical protein